MRALLCTENSNQSRQLTVGEVDRPTLDRGQVLVEVEAAAVNYVDTLIAAGRYQIPVLPPFIPGNDIAGRVVEVGSGSTRFTVGDRVHGMAFLGGFADYVAVPEARLRPTPPELTAEAASTAGSVYRTAMDALVSIAELEPGESVIVIGAAGAVGSAAIGIAKALGAQVIACASSAKKLAFCRSLGADASIDYTASDLRSELKRSCPAGADVVLDMVSGHHSEPALRSLRPGGRFVVVGFASGTIATIPLNLVLLKGVVVHGYEIGRFERERPRDAHSNRTLIEKLLVERRLSTPVTNRFDLAHAPAAMAVAGARNKCGVTALHVTPTPARDE